MSKEELIKLLKEMNFNEKNVSIHCEPSITTYEMVNGEGIEIIQYETTICIQHEEIERKYIRNGLTKVYEDEKILEEGK